MELQTKNLELIQTQHKLLKQEEKVKDLQDQLYNIETQQSKQTLQI